MAAQSTYTPIATYTAPGGTSAFNFTSIPQTYTDLVLVGYMRSAQAATSPGYYVRPNTGTGWSGTYIYSTGSGAASARYSLNTSDCQVGTIAGNSAPANVFSTSVTHFLNYSNVNTYKTFITRIATDLTNGSGYSEIFVNSTNSQNGIVSIIIYNDSNSNWIAGSTWTLYGITAA
jgi:hypothetical protein